MARHSHPARHERPAIDEAAMAAARGLERLLVEAQGLGANRWVEFLGPFPEALRDAALPDLRGVALRARAAYGPRDSIRDALSTESTEPVLADLDRLLKLLAREASGG
jgi:hypothetical protein